jgi:hypothetical protein
MPAKLLRGRQKWPSIKRKFCIKFLHVRAVRGAARGWRWFEFFPTGPVMIDALMNVRAASTKLRKLFSLGEPAEFAEGLARARQLALTHLTGRFLGLGSSRAVHLLQ